MLAIPHLRPRVRDTPQRLRRAFSPEIGTSELLPAPTTYKKHSRPYRQKALAIRSDLQHLYSRTHMRLRSDVSGLNCVPSNLLYSYPRPTVWFLGVVTGEASRGSTECFSAYYCYSGNGVAFCGTNGILTLCWHGQDRRNRGKVYYTGVAEAAPVCVVGQLFTMWLKLSRDG